jgi:hypothetical protein
MKTSRKRTIATKTQKKLHDIKPKKNPSGGRKAGGGHGKQKPVEYLKVDLNEVFVTSVNTAP